MTAACSTFEVGDLAHSKAKGYQSRRIVLEALQPLISCFVHHPVKLFVGFVVRRVDKDARRFVDQAVWFRGAREALAERDGRQPLDPQFTLVDRLSRMEEHLLEMRRTTLRLSEEAGTLTNPGGPLQLALRRMAGASAELYDEVRNFRGAVMAYEADRGVAVPGNAPVFSVEEFDEAAKKLMRTA